MDTPFSVMRRRVRAALRRRALGNLFYAAGARAAVSGGKTGCVKKEAVHDAVLIIAYRQMTGPNHTYPAGSEGCARFKEYFASLSACRIASRRSGCGFRDWALGCQV